MNNLNLDPGLRKAFSQQTHQRLLAESNQARLVKSLRTEKPDLRKLKSYSLTAKLKIIGQLMRETGANIITVMRANEDALNA
jgi:hypothetical protein